MDLYVTCCITQGTLLNGLWQPEWEVSPKERGDICMYIADSFCCPLENDTH